MKIFILLVFLFLGNNVIFSQQLYLESGKTISNFDYENSQGESLDNLQSSNHTYLNLGYRKSIFTKRLFINLNGSYNGYGSIGSDVDFDNYLEWDLSYLGAGIGADYEFYKPGNFTFYIKATAAAEFLIQGTQTLNNQVHNLSGEEDFETAIYFFRGGIGVQYKVSEALTVFNQYMYGTSGTFKDIQGDLKIKTHNFGLGLLINISKDQESISGDINNAQLEELKKELDANSQKIKELENDSKKELESNVIEKEKEIAIKEQELNDIKASISNALLPYKGEELTIEDRDGKVYVIMENELIFRSGSSNISAEGKKAIKDLGDVLAKNKDLNILIEGHTDNIPFKDKNISNWDLSVKRATSIVELLRKNENIDPKNLVAAGRGEFDPIDDNTTAEGRANNRRIEIVLTPKLEEFKKLIKN